MPQSKKKKTPKSQRAAVRRPLTPAVLDEMGVLKNWPPKAKPPAWPGAPRCFRILTCHGYIKTSNDDVGWLEISGGALKSAFLAAVAPYRAQRG